MRIEVQHTGFRKSARRRDTILDSRDRAPGSPNVIDDESGPAAQLVICRKLDELRPGDQLRFFLHILCGKIDGGGQDVRDIHCFG